MKMYLCLLTLVLLHGAAGFRIGHQDSNTNQQSVGWNIPFDKLPSNIRNKALILYLMKGWRMNDSSEQIQNPSDSSSDSEVSSEEEEPKMECRWLVNRSFTGKVSEGDHCVCEVLLPDSSFPAKRVGALEDETQHLLNRVEDEMQKIEEQNIRLDFCVEKIMNLTRRVERLEKMRPEELTEINFEVLKKEIKEMEKMITQLRGKVGGNNAHVETLYDEVKNISKTVGQLESLDKNNVLKTHRDMENLKKRLIDCQKDMKMKAPVATVPLEKSVYAIPDAARNLFVTKNIGVSNTTTYGNKLSAADNNERSCQHHGLSYISKPNLLQLNWKGVGFKAGAWGKDSAWNTTKKSMYWVGALNPDGRILESIRIYSNMVDIQLYQNSVDLPLSVFINNKWNHTLAGQGAGFIVYNNNLYYNCYNSRDICRVSLSTGVYQRKPLPNAAFNNQYSYAGVSYQDIDFASDEKGLWVIYTTTESKGRMVLGKINVATMTVDKAWVTTQMKPEVTNTFMMCGILYSTRSVNKKMEEIFYMFDTKTGKGEQISYMIEKMTEKVQSLSYNSNDRKLYMFNDAYLVHYDLMIKP